MPPELARAYDADLMILQAQANGGVSFGLELMRLARCTRQGAPAAVGYSRGGARPAVSIGLLSHE